MKKLVLILIGTVTFSMSCTKKDCYDASIVHNNACPADCPGFEGCDGKTYCNACEAARNGIGPK